MSEEIASTNEFHPVARAILQGVYDPGSPLSNLRGLWHVLRDIWRDLLRFWVNALQLQPLLPEQLIEFRPDENLPYFPLPRMGKKSTIFPKPQDIYVNMMPFIMSASFKESKLPKYLKDYHWLVKQLVPYCREDVGSVCYLTVHEGPVQRHETQRRPGLHTDSPGRMYLNNPDDDSQDVTLTSRRMGAGQSQPFRIPWGFSGSTSTQFGCHFTGGIYMASNVEDSCSVWNCKIIDDEAIGENGDVEHLRPTMIAKKVDRINMLPNRVYWITDQTPHESLPMKKAAYRQYFRIVTSDVGVWYEEHSTPNPMGVVPDPTKTLVVKGSKFEEGGVVVGPKKTFSSALKTLSRLKLKSK